MSEAEGGEQVNLAGETADVVFTAEVDARTFIPWLRLFDLYGEFKLHADAGGLSVEVVDPASICLVRAGLPADAFERFDVAEETALGIPREALARALSFARYGKANSDTIGLEYDDLGRLQVTVERDVAGVEVVGKDTVSLIDPDSIRQEPDDMGLELTAEATMPADAFAKILGQFNHAKHVTISQAGEQLTFSWDGDTESRELVATVEGSGESHSVFSQNYLEAAKNAASGSLADSVTLQTADEYPVVATIDREGYYSAQWACAPRITSGGG